MKLVLRGIPQVVIYFDDILISGATLQEHMNTLELRNTKPVTRSRPKASAKEVHIYGFRGFVPWTQD